MRMKPSTRPVKRVATGFRPAVERCISTISGRHRRAASGAESVLKPPWRNACGFLRLVTRSSHSRRMYANVALKNPVSPPFTNFLACLFPDTLLLLEKSLMKACQPWCIDNPIALIRGGWRGGRSVSTCACCVPSRCRRVLSAKLLRCCTANSLKSYSFTRSCDPFSHMMNLKTALMPAAISSHAEVQ